VAYRLNGQPISLLRGGPVRMIVPWAHGFKSIKWLQRIVLTNNHQANDTYASGNNDVESHLKTAAYVDSGPESVAAGQPVVVTGTVMVGLSGLRRVEYWLRADAGAALREDDPAWTRRPVAAVRAGAAAEELGRHAAERRAAQRRVGVRPQDGAAARMAAAVQLGAVVGQAARSENPAPMRSARGQWTSTISHNRNRARIPSRGGMRSRSGASP